MLAGHLSELLPQDHINRVWSSSDMKSQRLALKLTDPCGFHQLALRVSGATTAVGSRVWCGHRVVALRQGTAFKKCGQGTSDTWWTSGVDKGIIGVVQAGRFERPALFVDWRVWRVRKCDSRSIWAISQTFQKMNIILWMVSHNNPAWVAYLGPPTSKLHGLHGLSMCLVRLQLFIWF